MMVTAAKLTALGLEIHKEGSVLDGVLQVAPPTGLKEFYDTVSERYEKLTAAIRTEWGNAKDVWPGREAGRSG